MDRFVTHDQLDAAISGERARNDAHLDEAISRVEDDIRDTETRLRAEWTETVRYEVGKIEAHLTEQDRYIMRRRFEWPTWRRDLLKYVLASVIASGITYVIVHFAFGG